MHRRHTSMNAHTNFLVHQYSYLNTLQTQIHTFMNTYSEIYAGDRIVYTNSSGTTPVSGGSGTNYAVFASGPPGPPLSYFRVFGSTGTVQAVGSCP